MFYLSSLQKAIIWVRENETDNTQGRQCYDNPLQTTAGGKKIGRESRISILCGSKISIWWMVVK